MNRFIPTFSNKLIYIFTIDSPTHKGLLKIGDATIHTNTPLDKLTNNCKELNDTAHKRIKQYTQTAGVYYSLLHTELAIYNKTEKNGTAKKKAFRDYDVRSVLINSGKSPVEFDFFKRKSEWYRTDLNTAINAISAVKQGRRSLYSQEITKDKTPIIFRPSQEDAINLTMKQFKRGNNMLWNAKMRFGKTLTALEVIKRMPELLKKTIILTHRPVVSDGWFEDFNKIFYEDDNKYLFGSRTMGESIQHLIKKDNPFVYFASIQDLRGSALVGGEYEKNEEVFSVNWDFVIIDEAHEGTLTELGNNVLNEIVKDNKNTKVLKLSGTPFNIIGSYKENEIFTWDYVMEQKAKEEWDLKYFGQRNPYGELPEMQIYTYNLKSLIDRSNKYIDIEDKAFNFKELFRVWTGNIRLDKRKLPSDDLIGSFVNEKDVLSLLNLMTKEDDKSNYPYSTKEYRDYFKHSLWMVPGVKEAKALKTLMESHPVFGSGQFNIVNVAGEDDEEDSRDALKNVRNAISKVEENGGYTITLSCGKLTTGVTIPEWSAVFMLSGSYATSASSYLQTIFRVQSPGNIDGKVKEICYVFDFAPDRTLKMVAAARQLSTKPGAIIDRDMMGEFLNYCPVIGIEGSSMKAYDVGRMLQELKKSYADKVAKNGFDDYRLYNDHLLKAEGIDFKEFEDLRKIIGASKQTRKAEKVDVNISGLTNEEYEKIANAEKKPVRELTAEEKELLKRNKEVKSNRDKAISILRGISIRIPLLIYGADISINKDITIDSLTEIVDDPSWVEFMPNGLTKDHFNQYKKYYDPEIFITAGRQIRSSVLSADSLEPEERIKKISQIFATFKNPDKETVLTPWRVVNMHLGDTLGGYNFYNNDYSEELDSPRLINNGKVTNETLFNRNANLLEIHSKTGLYPLYLTYSLYKHKSDSNNLSLKDLWRETVENNIFIICKTKMSKFITKRTLAGYKNINPNILVIENIIDMMKNDKQTLLSQISNASTWKIRRNGKLQEGKMKFDAIVGNPPYQENLENRSEQPPIYHFFYNTAFRLSNKVSLITPARFLFNAGKTPKSWNIKMLSDPHFKVVRYEPNSKEIFTSVDIKGGVAITYRDVNQNFGEIGVFVKDDILLSVLKKVRANVNNKYLNEMIFSNTSYKYNEKLFKENPQFKDRLSGGSARYLSSSVFDKLPEIFFENKPKDGSVYTKIIGRQNNNRQEYYIKGSYINAPLNLDKYKVFIASSNGTGDFGETLSDPFVAEPNLGATETFVSFGSFNERYQAENLLKYIKTKFARALLGTLKVTQGNKNSHVWSNVVLQDFTNNSDIDWSKSIAEIDTQLYKIYNLTKKEIEFIEEKVKPMD